MADPNATGPLTVGPLAADPLKADRETTVEAPGQAVTPVLLDQDKVAKELVLGMVGIPWIPLCSDSNCQERD